jgi:InsA C-terminal domain
MGWVIVIIGVGLKLGFLTSIQPTYCTAKTCEPEPLPEDGVKQQIVEMALNSSGIRDTARSIG